MMQESHAFSWIRSVAWLFFLSCIWVGCGQQPSQIPSDDSSHEESIRQALELMSRGLDANNENLYRQAEDHLEQAEKHAPGHYRTCLAFAEYFQNDRWADDRGRNELDARANAFLERARKNDPDDVEVMLALAEYCNRPLPAMRSPAPTALPGANDRPDEDDIRPGRNPEMALELYRQVLKRQPGDLDVLGALGKTYLSLRRYPEAESVFLQGVELAEKAGDDYHLRWAREFLGRTYIKQKRFDQAEEVLKQSAGGLEEFNKKHQQYWGCPYQALGQLYSKMGHAGRSAEFYKKAADIEKENATSQYMAAIKCFEAGDIPGALAYLDRSLALDPNEEFRQLKMRIAADGKNALIASGPGDSKTFLNAAVTFFIQGDFEESMKQLQRTPALLAQPEGKILKGYLLLLTKAHSEAESLFREVQDSDPDGTGPLAGLGHLDLIGKRYDDAEKKFFRVLHRPNLLQPSLDLSLAVWIDFKMACLGMGWLHANQNRHQEAIRYYDRILSRYPDDLLALLGKGNSLSGLGRLDAAETLFQRVLNLQPENQYALAELALVKYNRGDDPGAEQAFQAALAVDDQQYTCPYEGLGLIYLRQGKWEQAKKYFNKAIEINPNIEYKKYNGLAKIQLKEGNVDRARKLLQKSIENYPYDGEAKELLEQIEGNNHKPDSSGRQPSSADQPG